MGVDVFRSFLKLPGGGETTRCFYPLKLDTYGRGCSHNCLYCYARSVLSFRGLWGDGVAADFAAIEKTLERAFSGGGGKNGELLRGRLPVRLGGMTDCFSRAEREHGVTRRLLTLLNHYRHPYLILTKSADITNYLDVIDPDLAYVQLSITTLSDDLSAVYEPGASLSSERLAACRALSAAGVYVAGRVNPLFPMYADGHFSEGKPSPPFNYFHWDLIDATCEAGAQTLIAGFLRLSQWNIRWIREATGQDLTWLFDPATKAKNQALHFSTEEKRYYYEMIKGRCDAQGVDFSVCYDGDESYNTFRYLWANPNDCCNGTGKVPGFTANYAAFGEMIEVQP